MWKVFAVKSLYRTSTSGKPKMTDENYRDEFDLLEERVVTIKARRKGVRKGVKYRIH